MDTLIADLHAAGATELVAQIAEFVRPRAQERLSFRLAHRLCAEAVAPSQAARRTAWADIEDDDQGSEALEPTAAPPMHAAAKRPDTRFARDDGWKAVARRPARSTMPMRARITQEAVDNTRSEEDCKSHMRGLWTCKKWLEHRVDGQQDDCRFGAHCNFAHRLDDDGAPIGPVWSATQVATGAEWRFKNQTDFVFFLASDKN